MKPLNKLSPWLPQTVTLSGPRHPDLDHEIAVAERIIAQLQDEYQILRKRWLQLNDTGRASRTVDNSLHLRLQKSRIELTRKSYALRVLQAIKRKRKHQ